MREGEEVGEGEGEGGSVDEVERDPLAYYERVKEMKRERKRLKKEAWEKRRERGEEGIMEDEETEEGKRAITYQVNQYPAAGYLHDFTLRYAGTPFLLPFSLSSLPFPSSLVSPPLFLTLNPSFLPSALPPSLPPCLSPLDCS